MNANERSEEGSGTIRVTVKVFGGLRELRPSPVEERATREGTTIDTLWRELESEDPPFVEKLRDGIEKGYLHVLLNGRNIVFLDGPNTRLHDGDTVAILPPIGGG